MKVFLNGKWHTLEDGPIIVKLSEADKKNISEMSDDNPYYAAAEDDWFNDNETFRAWCTRQITKDFT